MIFKRDEKGLLHQLDLKLEDLPDGTQTNMLVVQHMYVLFTDAEQQAFDEQRRIAQEKMLAQKKAAEDAQAAKQAVRDREISKSVEIQKAKEAAEAAKEHALMLALEAVAELKQQVEELKQAKVSS